MYINGFKINKQFLKLKFLQINKIKYKIKFKIYLNFKNFKKKSKKINKYKKYKN